MAILLAVTACGSEGANAPGPDLAAKAEALGVTLDDFEDAPPVLVAFAKHRESLFVALSLRPDHPKAVKRQLRSEVTFVALDCVEGFPDKKQFAAEFDRYNERLMRRASASETEVQWDAFTPDFRSRLSKGVADMIDLTPLVPERLIEAEGGKRTGEGATLTECEALFDSMSVQKLDFR